MRRGAVLVIIAVAVAVALVAASGVVLAANITCPNGPAGLCTGTLAADTMTGTPAADTMDGLGGNDTLKGLGASDTYTFSPNWGADFIPADGEDATMGTGDKLNFFSLGEPLDIDLVSSASRDEVYSVYSGAGMLNFPPTVQIEDVEGGRVRDVIRGTEGSNHLSGGFGGNDSLYGRGGDDNLIGGSGADALIGGLGADNLKGDLGDDTIDVKDGQTDSVDCGLGNDTVFFDEGIDSLTDDCENRNPPQQ